MSQEHETSPEEATDEELADFLIGHIDKPCEVEVAPGQIENIRRVYIEEAERAIPTMTDPVAIEKLRNKIKEYKP